MNTIQNRNQTLETVAWGALFIWWGITELIPSLPNGAGAVGIGLILLGLNAARYLNGIRASAFTVITGVLMLLWGGLEMMGNVLRLPFEIPVFAILLIALGAILAGRVLVENKNES